MPDEKDRAILAALEENARQPTARIASQVGIPRTTVGERIRKLETEGIIKRFTVHLDYEKLGLPITAFILVSFLPNPDISQRQLATRISAMEKVYEVHIISGEWDLLVKVRGSSMEEMGDLIIDRLRSLKGVGKTVTCTCFSTLTENV